MATEPMHAVLNDEKSLLVYKPVNPLVFPSGQATGSPDLPIKFKTNCLLNHKGTNLSPLLLHNDWITISPDQI